MRREERVTVQGPVKKQQPDGMSHRGGGGGVNLVWEVWRFNLAAQSPTPNPGASCVVLPSPCAWHAPRLVPCSWIPPKLPPPHCPGTKPPPPPPDSGCASGCPGSTAQGNSPSPGRPTSRVVKQDKSSGGSADTTKTRSDPQRVRMSSGERPIGAAKGKQSDTEALCQPPPPPS